MLDDVDRLECRRCGNAFPPARRARCPHCADGGALRFVYRTRRLAPFDRGTWARREPWLWRFRELLPFDDDLDPPPLQVGLTPLYGSPRLAAACGVRGLFVKDESRNPTGRIADRAAALLVAEALSSELPLATGALGPSVAAFAASAQKPCVALLDADDDANAIAAFGAAALVLGKSLGRTETLLRLCDDGFALADFPHPLALEGLKTLGLELGDQLAERLPDWIALDGAQDGLVEAVQLGLAQCAELGLFRSPPQLLAAGGSDGGAQVSVREADCAKLADEARRALGLPIPPGGARALAALQRGVRDGVVPADALALVVVEAPTAPQAKALKRRRPLSDYVRLRAAAREANHR
ncbi:MAG: pyridoxal-phosphate dependent enzyme [Deltaproteobacteria bacterium]|nr:pyridoxal-phosphate dependent enzyme [Deltaproteobacteria bacterium]